MMKSEVFRTKHFNIVTNSKHGACLMFDRKGQGISRTSARHTAKKVFNIKSVKKLFLSLQIQAGIVWLYGNSLRHQVQNGLRLSAQNTEATNIHSCDALSPQIAFRR